MMLSSRRNEKRDRGARGLNVQDVPRTKRPNVDSIRQSPPPLSKGKYFWMLDNERDTFGYITMGNGGELRAVKGTPNHTYGPNIFGLEPGTQGGQYIINTYAMIPTEGSKQYALVPKQDINGQWKLAYSNEKGPNYNWNFSYENDSFAIRWYNERDTSFALYLDNDELKLINIPSDNSLPSEHFISTFKSIY